MLTKQQYKQAEKTIISLYGKNHGLSNDYITTYGEWMFTSHKDREILKERLTNLMKEDGCYFDLVKKYHRNDKVAKALTNIYIEDSLLYCLYDGYFLPIDNKYDYGGSQYVINHKGEKYIFKADDIYEDLKIRVKEDAEQKLSLQDIVNDRAVDKNSVDAKFLLKISEKKHKDKGIER